MQGSAIEAERGLQERLRESARRELGPEANDSEVEALGDVPDAVELELM